LPRFCHADYLRRSVLHGYPAVLPTAIPQRSPPTCYGCTTTLPVRSAVLLPHGYYHHLRDCLPCPLPAVLPTDGPHYLHLLRHTPAFWFTLRLDYLHLLLLVGSRLPPRSSGYFVTPAFYAFWLHVGWFVAVTPRTVLYDTTFTPPHPPRHHTPLPGSPWFAFLHLLRTTHYVYAFTYAPLPTPCRITYRFTLYLPGSLPAHYFAVLWFACTGSGRGSAHCLSRSLTFTLPLHTNAWVLVVLHCRAVPLRCHVTLPRTRSAFALQPTTYRLSAHSAFSGSTPSPRTFIYLRLGRFTGSRTTLPPRHTPFTLPPHPPALPPFWTRLCIHTHVLAAHLRAPALIPFLPDTFHLFSCRCRSISRTRHTTLHRHTRRTTYAGYRAHYQHTPFLAYTLVGRFLLFHRTPCGYTSSLFLVYATVLLPAHAHCLRCGLLVGRFLSYGQFILQLPDERLH